MRSGPECLCLLWFVKPAHCQFTQLYFGTPGCQLAEFHSSSCAPVPVGVVNLATCECVKSEEEGLVKKTVSNILNLDCNI